MQLPQNATSAVMRTGKLTPALSTQHIPVNLRKLPQPSCSQPPLPPPAPPTDAHLESAGLWCVFHTLLVMNTSPRLPAARNSASPSPTTDSLP